MTRPDHRFVLLLLIALIPRAALWLGGVHAGVPGWIPLWEAGTSLGAVAFLDWVGRCSHSGSARIGLLLVSFSPVPLAVGTRSPVMPVVTLLLLLPLALQPRGRTVKGVLPPALSVLLGLLLAVWFSDPNPASTGLATDFSAGAVLSRLAATWVAVWSSPIPVGQVPDYLQPLLFLVFGVPVLLVGAVGLQWKTWAAKYVSVLAILVSGVSILLHGEAGLSVPVWMMLALTFERGWRVLTERTEDGRETG